MNHKIPQIAILASALFLGAPFLPWNDTPNTVQAQYLQLTAEQMQAALLCPTDESKAFITDCYELVARGIVPESLVLSSFNYAYQKPKNRWVYFQASLVRRCEKLRIDLWKEIQKLHD
ncbi:MAG: hypothetical protein J6A23_15030 [Thermoguttaceae bacterium]|nr:hypothetical protein [Thermoguttaceae bacterium]